MFPGTSSISAPRRPRLGCSREKIGLGRGQEQKPYFRYSVTSSPLTATRFGYHNLSCSWMHRSGSLSGSSSQRTFRFSIPNFSQGTDPAGRTFLRPRIHQQCSRHQLPGRLIWADKGAAREARDPSPSSDSGLVQPTYPSPPSHASWRLVGPHFSRPRH